jgi:hypothetical protein
MALEVKNRNLKSRIECADSVIHFATLVIDFAEYCGLLNGTYALSFPDSGAIL